MEEEGGGTAAGPRDSARNSLDPPAGPRSAWAVWPLGSLQVVQASSPSPSPRGFGSLGSCSPGRAPAQSGGLPVGTGGPVQHEVGGTGGPRARLSAGGPEGGLGGGTGVSPLFLPPTRGCCVASERLPVSVGTLKSRAAGWSSPLAPSPPDGGCQRRASRSLWCPRPGLRGGLHSHSCPGQRTEAAGPRH